MTEHTSEYVPGVCNIGAAEIEQRRRSAIAGAAVTGAIGVAMLAARVPRRIRLAIAIPAAGTAVAALQARERFCVAFAARGVQNVAGPLGAAVPVADERARAADRRRVVGMAARGAAIGGALALAFAGLP